MSFWAVARTLPQRDRLAGELIVQQGFEIFAPRIRTRIDSRWRTTPLFAGYLFVRIIDRWRVIERTIGVLSLVRFGDQPARCPDAEIARLLQLSDPDGVVRLGPSREPGRARYAAGTRVTVTGGPLKGFRGLHSGLSTREREVILLELLGRQTQVTIAAGLIAAR
jgi:transcriptional antiterminator RfaH